MTDRHGPWILILWTLGILALAATLATIWTALATPPASGTVRTPITSISPTNPAAR